MGMFSKGINPMHIGLVIFLSMGHALPAFFEVFLCDCSSCARFRLVERPRRQGLFTPSPRPRGLG